MFNRYPHIASIEINTTSKNDSGIPSNAKITLEIKGRYEPNTIGKNLDYSAKFFCPVINLKEFQADGQVLIFGEKRFKIAQLYNYQSHCEIWLE